MDLIQNFFSSYWAYLVPALISLALIVFVKRSQRSISHARLLIEKERYLRMRHMGFIEDRAPETTSPIKELLLREDVTLRILEEVHEQPRYRKRMLGGSEDSVRLHILDSLELELQGFLRESVKSNDFSQIRDRSLALLDEIRTEKAQLQQREPFNDIQDPEKSLLIDIFHEIDVTQTVAKQKVVQLSNIIKIKHQDILKLQSDNARAANWTRWGAVGTIFFGILSLVLSVISIRWAMGGV